MTVLVATSSEAELQELVTRVAYTALQVTGSHEDKREKSEVMKVCENAPPMRITVNGDTISEVSSLKYLGEFPRSNTLERSSMPRPYVTKREEIKTRLALARERMGKYGSPMAKSGYEPSSESKAHSDMVWPIVT